MEDFIVKEARLFIDSLYTGLIIMTFYDVLRLLRRIVKHKDIFVSIEDFLFWNIAGIFIFSLIYSQNDGRIRWFIIVGICIGAYVYAKSFGRFLVKYTSKIINKILNIVLKKPLNKVKMTIRYIYRKVVTLGGKKLWKKEKDT